jgi:hypothetical protein
MYQQQLSFQIETVHQRLGLDTVSPKLKLVLRPVTSLKYPFLNSSQAHTQVVQAQLPSHIPLLIQFIVARGIQHYIKLNGGVRKTVSSQQSCWMKELTSLATSALEFHTKGTTKYG